MPDIPHDDDDDRIELKEVIGVEGTWTVVSTDNGSTPEGGK